MKARLLNSLVSVVRREPLAFLAFLVSLISLWLSFMTTAPVWASSKIRDLISAEAEAALNRQIPLAVSLYEENALIRDLGTNGGPDSKPRSWQGQQQIRERYMNLPKFKHLVHVDVNVVDLNYFAGEARATSSTSGILLQEENGKTTEYYVGSLNGDIWQFKRVGGSWYWPWNETWKIVSFTYHATELKH